jgi:two-component SAPR family response regulator
MPREVNGIQLAAQAPRLQPTLKVLLISGYTAGAPTDTHRLPEQFPGLAKPYRREQLAANPREIIDGKAAEKLPYWNVL